MSRGMRLSGTLESAFLFNLLAAHEKTYSLTDRRDMFWFLEPDRLTLELIVPKMSHIYKLLLYYEMLT